MFKDEEVHLLFDYSMRKKLDPFQEHFEPFLRKEGVL